MTISCAVASILKATFLKFQIPLEPSTPTSVVSLYSSLPIIPPYALNVAMLDKILSRYKNAQIHGEAANCLT
ncbi:unnamed protein product [Danaus chrysippus]|uniref:(African queen) hypothetical protein n=1 Tax=Danaus chrysippus TaxID=151541 RepID=A0A8J2VQF6_9NEOP|nr:unnamed protein product [Danaus chrysippus]